MTLCDLCLEYYEETRHFALYVFGSEGIRVCHACEMGLMKYCHEQTMNALRRHKKEHKERQCSK